MIFPKIAHVRNCKNKSANIGLFHLHPWRGLVLLSAYSIIQLAGLISFEFVNLSSSLTFNLNPLNCLFLSYFSCILWENSPLFYLITQLLCSFLNWFKCQEAKCRKINDLFAEFAEPATKVVSWTHRRKDNQPIDWYKGWEPLQTS